MAEQAGAPQLLAAAAAAALTGGGALSTTGATEPPAGAAGAAAAAPPPAVAPPSSREAEWRRLPARAAEEAGGKRGLSESEVRICARMRAAVLKFSGKRQGQQ